VFVLGVVAACGSSAPSATTSGPPAAMQATPAAGDIEIARVNGQPVWGSCVAAQAAGGRVTRDQAVRDCIDFELMAQAAEHRGLARDPEVIEQTRTALVDRVVAVSYELGYRKPEDFGDAWDEFVKKRKMVGRLKHPEYRASVHVLVPVPAGGDDTAAHALAAHIAAATADERGMLEPHFLASVRTVTPIVPCATGITVPCWERLAPFLPFALEAPFSDALWKIPEIGRTAGPVRSSFGWHVILWTDSVPATDPTPDQITASILAEIKPWYFARWVLAIGKQLGVQAEIAPDVDAQLEAVR
jgi:hypothetical protein